jgi:hypothetical protein
MIGEKFVGLKCKNEDITFVIYLHGFGGIDNPSVLIFEPITFYFILEIEWLGQKV